MTGRSDSQLMYWPGIDDVSGEPVGSCPDCGGDMFQALSYPFLGVCDDSDCVERRQWLDALVESDGA